MKLNTYSKKTISGFLSLIGIVLIAMLIYYAVDKYDNNSKKISVTNATADWMKTTPQPSRNTSQYPTTSYNSEVNHSLSDDARDIPYAPSTFDPNTASFELMIANGVPIGSAKRIIAYRNKGGTFYQKEKLKNFGIDDQTYSKIEPYLSVPNKSLSSYTSSSGYKKYDNSYTPKPEPTNLDINSATQDELMLFKGIGPGYSKRIIEYRNKLGGFLTVDQVKEVYGLPDSVFMHIKDKIIINKGITKININTATFEQLAEHPYIRKFLAEKIIKFRDDIKEFKSIQELKQIPLINDEKYRKIVPYITL